MDCGDQHTALVTPSGDLYTLGDNSEGQLGLGIDYKTFTDKATLVTGMLDRVAEVSAGYRHTLILTERGSVYGMGTNRRHELGLAGHHNKGQSLKSLSPVKIQSLDAYNVTKVKAGSFSAVVTSDHDILIWGTGDFGSIQMPVKLTTSDSVKYKDLALGKGKESFGAAIDIDGYLYTWGDNNSGQLGLGDFISKKAPIKVN